MTENVGAAIGRPQCESYVFAGIWRKNLAEFAADAANKIKIVFGRGVYVDKNTSQAASVEFVCHRQTNYARSRLQTPVGKARRAFSTSSEEAACRFLFFTKSPAME